MRPGHLSGRAFGRQTARLAGTDNSVQQLWLEQLRNTEDLIAHAAQRLT
jgi:hypothetical protein